MTLELLFHPLSQYCQKVLIALYENETPFEKRVIDLSNEASRAELVALWPMGKFPLLRDTGRDQVVVEASIIIEYLAQHYAGRTALVPSDPDVARRARMQNRFFDLYVADSVAKVVTDRFRPEGKHDVEGVAQAKTCLRTALDVAEKNLGDTWVVGDAFTMADCAAAPSLFYANIVMPFGETHPRVSAYLRRALERPSFARTTREAAPFLALMPK